MTFFFRLKYSTYWLGDWLLMIWKRALSSRKCLGIITELIGSSEPIVFSTQACIYVESRNGAHGSTVSPGRNLHEVNDGNWINYCGVFLSVGANLSGANVLSGGAAPGSCKKCDWNRYVKTPADCSASNRVTWVTSDIFRYVFLHGLKLYNYPF